MKSERILPGVFRPGLLFLISFLITICSEIGLSQIVFNRIETSNFEIFFTPESEEAALELYERAEQVYSKVSDFLGYTLDEKVRVYVVRDHDYVNAYADPAFNSIVIYPNIPSGALHFVTPDFESWMEFVFTHELIHIFIGNRLSWYFKPFSIFGQPVARSLQALFIPMYIQEGAAVYGETRLSRSGRLRYPFFLSLQEVAHDGLGYAGGADTRYQSLGGLSYVQGSSILYFLSMEYGEKTMLKIVKAFLDNPLAGFGTAISKTLEKPSSMVIAQWRRWIEERTQKRFSEHVFPDMQEGWMLRPLQNGDFAFVDMEGIHIGSKIVPVAGLMDYSVSQGGRLAIIKLFQQNSHVWHSLIVEGRLVDYHTVDIAWKDDEHLWAIKQDGNGRRYLLEYILEDSSVSKKTLITSSSEFLPLELADGNPAYMVARYKGQIDLFLYDETTGQILNITNDEKSEENPSFSQRSNAVCFSAPNNSETSIYLLKQKESGYESFKILTTSLAVTDPILMNDGILLSYVSRDGLRHIGKSKIAPQNAEEQKLLKPVPIQNSPASSKNTTTMQKFISVPKLRFWIPFALLHEETLTPAIAFGFVDDYNMSFIIPIFTSSGISCLAGYLKNPSLFLWLGPQPQAIMEWRFEEPASLTGNSLTLTLYYRSTQPGLGLSYRIGKISTRYFSAPKLALDFSNEGIKTKFYERLGNTITWIGTSSKESEVIFTGFRSPLTLLDVHTTFGYAFLDALDLGGELKIENDGQWEVKSSLFLHGAIHYFLNFTAEAGVRYDGRTISPVFKINLGPF